MTVLSLSAELNEAQQTRRRITAEVFSPAILAFAVSIVRDAAARGAKRIYFLARDGYTLKKAAEQVCAVCGIDLECRYLYCSRLSLRTAEYFLDEDAYMKRLQNGCARLTENTLFSRIQLNHGERSAVLADISRTYDPDHELSRSELRELCRQLSESCVFCRIMEGRSQEAFERTVEYFDSEGLFSDNTVYIADSGWCGTMQQSLTALIRASGAKQRVFGYYFGLFSAPEEVSANSRCFYFAPRKNAARKAKFCNNLIEIALAAPHPMTVGYEYSGGRVRPVFSEYSAGDEENAVRELISRDIEDYCRKNAADFMKLSEKELVEAARKSIVPFMTDPDFEQAEAFADVKFCDDSSGCYAMAVSERSETAEFFRQTVLFSAARRLLHVGKPGKCFIWFGGSAALSKLKLRKFWQADHTLRRYIQFLISR